ncbi:unnamed protein product [Macrosiphum euphorbiae]|uniref:Integrase catalytic domain-containing protein n=1 Tax=Macrosiphum euphorbiae TaxID=13131 RepID=A0AAV0X3C4_9HEMI|nr:unnamed protein product [Macrosiphum euphorbiae]
MTNGALERSHKILAEYLRHYVSKSLDNWDELLPYAMFVYNSTEHTSTRYQPYALLYGKNINIPVKLKAKPEPRYNYDDNVYDLKQKFQEAHQIARNRLIKNKEVNKRYYDKKTNTEELKINDMILLKDHTQRNKLSPLWKGPYEVLDVLDSENVVMSRNRNKVTVHKNDVKLYYEDNNMDNEEVE